MPLRLLALLLLSAVLIQCAAPPTPTPPPTPTRTPLPTAQPTRVPTSVPPTATPTAAPSKLWLEPNLPEVWLTAVEQVAAEQRLSFVSAPAEADLRVTLVRSPDPLLLAERVYAVADRFATLRDGVRLADIERVWQSGANDAVSALIVTPDTATALTPLLGAPGPAVRQVEPQALVDAVWQTPHALAIVPFDELEPRLIAQPIDGKNILDHSLDLSDYPLIVRAYVEGQGDSAVSFYNALHGRVEATNRAPDRMTSIVMTGVTAMGRFTADAIDRSGDPAFPARVVGDILSKADITHVSNEIPFVPNCPPNLVEDSIRLCSKPEYIETFKVMGVDIVGLTGNHAGDFGYDNYVQTLDLYAANGMKTYAGGRNLAQARKPLIMTHNGNRIAFLGANSFGPESYWATDSKPGTNGYVPARMKEDIAAARQQAELVFVEYQADEVYDYKPDTTNQQIFRQTLADGADVVTGVQNHQPAAIEFGANGATEILYGLGNFSFDQMYNDDVRGGLIPRHLVYKGKLLQTELLTTMLEASAQPRWATPAEREHILRGVLGASDFPLE